MAKVNHRGKILSTNKATPEDEGGTHRRKDQERPKKRKGEAEKLLADRTPRSTRAASTTAKATEKTKKVKGDLKVS